jgi:hypothetical protein
VHIFQKCALKRQKGKINFLSTYTPQQYILSILYVHRRINTTHYERAGSF